MDAADRTIIELRHVYKSFGKQVVLKDINLKIERGKTTVVLGESGTGKSVLLKNIVVLMRPDRGQIFHEGRDLTHLPERQLQNVRTQFGFLFQAGALFDSMTAAENVAFPLREHTDYKDEKILEIVQEKLKLVGLESVTNRMPGQLSGGQKKRVALARAIALEPQTILYDEPTTGLDPIRADIIDELILKLKEHLHVTSVVVTHDMKSAFKVADRILMLYHGNFIFDGTPDEIRQTADERIQRFIAGEADPKDLEILEMS
jgi:phospholipid/cholesterol/gamma-HCH transport system ATP-binding protein